MKRRDVVDYRYHEHRFKHFNLQYIYRICNKNAKKANPIKWICPIKKTRSHAFIDVIFI